MFREAQILTHFDTNPVNSKPLGLESNDNAFQNHYKVYELVKTGKLHMLFMKFQSGVEGGYACIDLCIFTFISFWTEDGGGAQNPIYRRNQAR